MEGDSDRWSPLAPPRIVAFPVSIWRQIDVPSVVEEADDAVVARARYPTLRKQNSFHQ